MKMTITIHGVDEDFAQDLERDIENACAYYDRGGMGPSPACEMEYGDDDSNYEVRKCAMCGADYYVCDLDERGMCDDCADEIRNGKES